MKYNYPVHRTKDAFSAIKLAEWLKVNGKYDFFRGQRHTFDIQPNLFRKGVNKEESADRLARFSGWIHSTPELKSLHNNPNAILAVAQNHGIKTNLIDFTNSPKVAGFFATDGGKKHDTGTIICLNKKRFENSWSDINDEFYKDKGSYLTELIEIDVKNLWRLQAQQGLFLKCQVDYVTLEMFSCFLHIHFPQNEKTKIFEQELIYPNSKSHLEVLLDQYFLIDSYPKRQMDMEAIYDVTIKITDNYVLKAMKTYFINDQLPPIHNSWDKDINKLWLIEPDEKYNQEKANINITIVIQSLNNVADFEDNIRTQLQNAFNSFLVDKKSVNWLVKNENDKTLYVDSEEFFVEEENEWTEFKVEEMINSIYSGMRILPYSENDIITSIARYITIAMFGIDKIFGIGEIIEFVGGQIMGNGFCSTQKIKSAIRDDYFSFIKPHKLNSKGELEMRDLIFTARYIKHSYNFDKFVSLFVEDIIPTQAALFYEKLVIITNPMRIDILGHK